MLEGATKLMSFFRRQGVGQNYVHKLYQRDRLRTDSYVNNELTDSSIIRPPTAKTLSILTIRKELYRNDF
jgi:hypothetical protein